MRLSSSFAFASLLVLACKGDASDSTTQPETTSTAETTADLPTTEVVDPSTTTTGVPTTTTGDTTTTDTTTGEPLVSCITYNNENACAGDTRCKWSSVFSWAHGIDGCQGDIVERCVAKTDDTPSSWYRGDASDAEVIVFDYVPTDLPEEWKPCDCDGPLACLCATDAPDCPNRLGEFCGATKAKATCENAVINNEFVCGYFVIYPNGPIDGECTTQSNFKACLPADDADLSTCTKILYDQYDNNVCNVPIPPAFWREVNGVFEVTTSCGPIPSGEEWSPCLKGDTTQPDDCACACGEAI